MSTYRARLSKPRRRFPLGRGLEASRRWAGFILLGVVFTTALQIAVQSGLISKFVIPTPSSVAVVFYEDTKSGIHLTDTLATVEGTLIGFVVGSALAIALAALITSFGYLEALLLPYINAFQTLPKVAIAPVIVLSLGFGLEGKVVLVAINAFFPVLINAIEGMRIRDRELYSLVRSLDVSTFQMIRYLRIPSSAPYIFAGLHLALIYSWVGAIVSEFVGSTHGLGVVLLQASAAFDMPSFFSILLLLMILGVVADQLLTLVERRLIFWARDLTKMAR